MTYLLIHGGGSTGRFWDRVVPLLDGAALAVDLPGRAGKPGDLATQTVEDEVASVLADVAAAGLADVAAAGLADPITVVAHSSGGLPTPGVVAGLRAAGHQVDRIVLSAALAPAEGAMGIDCMRPRHQEGLRWAVAVAAETGEPMIVLGVPDDPEDLRTAYGGDPLSDEDLAFAADPVRCVPDTVHHYFQPVRWSQVAGVPVTYVLNERDRPVAPAMQESMAAGIPGPVELIRLDIGHCPAITHPDLLAGIITG